MAQKYDLVLYGSTGFTGRLAVRYVAKQYQDTIRWAVAGRNRAKLEALAAEEGAGYPDIIVADSTNEKSLQDMCAATKVVATTAGPFARYGTPVVKACVEAGCDYCDITGEAKWVRDMVADYDDAARSSGSRIVHLCGHDSVPWDISTLMLAKKLKQKGEDLARVDFYDKIKTSPSGGTLETAMGIMFGEEKKAKASIAAVALGFDPMLKPRPGTAGPSPCKTSIRNVNTLAMSTKSGQPHRSIFFMAAVNGTTVKRSNALNHYGPKVEYCEGTAFSSYFSALAYFLSMCFVGLCMVIPPVRWLLRAYVLPKPGEGPSEEYMEKGFLNLTGVAKGTGGTEVKSKLRFFVDPGYKDTARMLVESALSLSLDNDKLEDKSGGVLTPASCQGEVLLNRLVKTGCTFTCE